MGAVALRREDEEEDDLGNFASLDVDICLRILQGGNDSLQISASLRKTSTKSARKNVEILAREISQDDHGDGDVDADEAAAVAAADALEGPQHLR